MGNNLLNIKRNIVAFYIIVTSAILIYSIIHYFYGNLKFYLPFFILSEIGFTAGYIYFKKTLNYEKTVFIFFISGAFVAYAAFLDGGIDKTGKLWPILLISVSYLLLPVKKANIFTFGYMSVLSLTAISHVAGLIHLPYKPLSYITMFFILFIIIYVGNSVIKETVETLYMLEKFAHYDSLTRVYNRRKLSQILQNEIERAKRYQRPLSILILDVDNFKEINDTYGHSFGDEVLKEIAKILKMNIRKTDYVGRLGGEEFILILPETVKENAYKVAEKIRKAVEIYFEKNYGKRLTVSIGVSQLYDFDNQLLKDIIELADRALYKAKRNGKNMVVVH